MKKTTLTTMLMLCITAYSFCQTAKNIQTTTIKGRGNAMDTIITKKNELSFNKTYLNNYKRDEAVVEALKPYLVSDMVTPGNYSHPAYLARIKEAKEKLPLAKADLLARMKSSQNIREKMSKINITNETDLNTISFVYTPVYYPTPNIVFFKNGDNIAKYYNLARGGLKYLALRNNKLIGFLNFYDENSTPKSDFFTSDQLHILEGSHLHITESYDQVVKMGKTPIIINNGISIDPYRTGGGNYIRMFGYVQSDRLILSHYDEGVQGYELIDGHGTPPPSHFFKKETLETAESFFSSNIGPSTIEQWLEQTVNSLKNAKKLPPKK